MSGRASEGEAKDPSRPLLGKRVLVARAADQASATAELLRGRGAEPVVVPLLEIVPPDDPLPMQRAITALPGDARAAAFTSANGVERTFAELARQGRDAGAFHGVLVAAVGPGTAAALERHGATPDVVAKEFRGEGLAEELLARVPSGARIVIFRAKVAREVLPETLRAAGRVVDVVPVYETKAPPREVGEALRARLLAGEIDAVTLTSASTVEHLVALLGPDAPRLLEEVVVAAIGPITSEAAQKLGVRVDCTANPHTLEDLVRALEARFAQQD